MNRARSKERAARRRVTPSRRRADEREASFSSATGLGWRAGLIVIAGVVTYWNSLSGPFVLDDQGAIVDNRQIRQWWRLANVLSPEPDSAVAGRPLVNLSLAINYATGELDVRGYHLWNLAIHLLSALLVFAIVRRTLELPSLYDRFGRRSVNLAFATALIWTLHPLNSEVVNYLIQRTESMMALCYLLTLYASLRALRSQAGTRWQAMAVLSCVVGTACKESIATAPLMVVLYDRVFAFDSLTQALRTRWRFYACLAATWLALAALIWSGPRASVAGFSSGVHPWTYLINQTVIITRYLGLAVWPRSLVAFYGWPLPLTLGDVLPSALLISFLLLLTVVALVRQSKFGFLGAWCYVTLAPTSSVLPIATEVGAERRMYLPLMALVALAVIGGSLVWELAKSCWRQTVSWQRSTVETPRPRGTRSATRLASVGGALLLLMVSSALAVGTVARNREYASRLSLARTIVERRPTSVAHHILGEQLMLAGAHEEAVMHLREAVRGGNSRALYNLGVELYNAGKLDEAIERLQAFVRTWRSPVRLVPQWLEPPLADVISARAVMGQAYSRQERWPQAAEQFRLILALRPATIEARGLLATALFKQEAYEEAIGHYREYLKSRGNDTGALTNLGIALVAAEKLDEAILAFRRAVQIDPRNAGAHRNLANALYDHREPDEAARHARQALTLNPDDPAAHALLGRALAVQGQLDEARRQFERALQIDPTYTEARENLGRLDVRLGRR